MTPLPKRKLSNGRRDRRRAQTFKLTLGALGSCPSCGEPLKAYHVCAKCGMYRKAKVLNVGKDAKKS